MVRFFGLTIAALLLNGCADTTDAPPQQEPAVLRVEVFADGRILADDQVVDLSQLAQQLSSLKKSGGVVWYYREAADEEPHPNAMRVMELVVEHKLPISMSTKPDFSDAVGPDGIPHPR